MAQLPVKRGPRGAARRIPSGSALAIPVLLCCLVSSCGGGSGGGTGTTPPPVGTSAADAARLLDQATFGVTAADVASVQAGGIDAWLTSQIALPATQYAGYTYTPHTAPTTCKSDGVSPLDAAGLCARDQYSLFQVQRQFFQHALTDTDQLRQRVAFALSQIFVVSSVEIYEAYGLAAYQNTLLNDALGNYRQLLEDVTLSPVMGHYLDVVDNDKPNPAKGTTPNENYAREVLQLFSIGLYELNADGTQQLDASNAPIPSYTQDTVEGFSAVFTGWTYPALPAATSKWTNPINFNGTMVAFEAHHDDTDPKPLLNGYSVPPNQTAEQDLANALDNIFNHPNVGPFIGKQLIQKLVTSNPSPAYVARISAVFANDGKGVRGNLAAVVRAILTDPEARGDQPATTDVARLKEPALFITGTMRSLGGKSDAVYLRNASSAMGQPIFSPETVFNFYAPTYRLPGTQTLAPEFGIDNAATALARANFVNTLIMQNGAAPDVNVAGSTGTSIDLTPFATTSDPATLVQQMSQTLMHGSLPADASTIIANAVDAVTSTDATAKARVATYLILSSGQYQVER